MKAVVIFYSFDGNCTLVAEEIRDELNADMIQLQTKVEPKCCKIARFFWSFGKMFSRKNPPLKPVAFDPSLYDLIILGAPVWGYAPASPMRTFLSGADISEKKIALFVCHAGGVGKSLEKFKALLADNEIIAEADFFNAAKRDKKEVKQQIEQWIKTF